MWKMFGTLFVFSFITVITVLITRDAMSTPQIGVQFGEIHNNGTGGDNVQNSTASVPGSGYPGSYYSYHSNDSSPTSPSMSGGSLDLQNSTFESSTCDCSQITDVQENEPTDATTNGPSDSDPANSASSAANDASSSE